LLGNTAVLYACYIKTLSLTAYFDVVVGFVKSYEPKSYAGGSLGTGRVSHAMQVKGDGPDKKGYPDIPGWRAVTGRK
jgi:hypothetical protein